MIQFLANDMEEYLKYRAWYKPDFDTKNGALKFIPKMINDSLYFVMEIDNSLYYPFDVIFLDNNWIVNKSTEQLDKNEKYIFEGDVINAFEKEYTVIYNTDIKKYDYVGFILQSNDKYENILLWDYIGYFEIVGNIYEKR